MQGAGANGKQVRGKGVIGMRELARNALCSSGHPCPHPCGQKNEQKTRSLGDAWEQPLSPRTYPWSPCLASALGMHARDIDLLTHTSWELASPITIGTVEEMLSSSALVGRLSRYGMSQPQLHAQGVGGTRGIGLLRQCPPHGQAVPPMRSTHACI